MANKTKVNFIKTLWGVSPAQGNTPAGYDKLFAHIKAEGFDGVETPISFVEDKVAFGVALRKHDMAYVAMINTCVFAPDPTTADFDAHVASFRRLVREAKELNPIFINSHSGRDSWSLETSKKFFEQALKIEEEENIDICHETHRGRILYNPWIVRDMCKEFPALKLTADLSHFCVVAERVFDKASGLDDDWEEIIDIVADRCRHVHARVGYSEGPQVPNPAAPEYLPALELHEQWWDKIMARQAAKGVKTMYLEPEHGTMGYQHEMPWGGEVGDLWVINNWIKDRQMERMSKQAYWEPRQLTFSAQHPCDMKAQSETWNNRDTNGSWGSKIWMAAAVGALTGFVLTKFIAK